VGRQENGQASNFNAIVLDDEGIKEAITMKETTMVDEDKIAKGDRTMAEEDLITNAAAIHYAKAKEYTTLEESLTVQRTEVHHEDTVEDITIGLAKKTALEPRTLSVNVIASNAIAASPNTIAKIEDDHLEARDVVFEDVHNVQRGRAERQRQEERTLEIIEIRPKAVNIHCAQTPNPAHLRGIKVLKTGNTSMLLCVQSVGKL
jgi:hypothetical protein